MYIKYFMISMILALGAGLFLCLGIYSIYDTKTKIEVINIGFFFSLSLVSTIGAIVFGAISAVLTGK